MNELNLLVAALGVAVDLMVLVHAWRRDRRDD